MSNTILGLGVEIANISFALTFPQGDLTCAPIGTNIKTLVLSRILPQSYLPICCASETLNWPMVSDRPCATSVFAVLCEMQCAIAKNFLIHTCAESGLSMGLYLSRLISYLFQVT